MAYVSRFLSYIVVLNVTLLTDEYPMREFNDLSITKLNILDSMLF